MSYRHHHLNRREMGDEKCGSIVIARLVKEISTKRDVEREDVVVSVFGSISTCLCLKLWDLESRPRADGHVYLLIWGREWRQEKHDGWCMVQDDRRKDKTRLFCVEHCKLHLRHPQCRRARRTETRWLAEREKKPNGRLVITVPHSS